MLEVSINKLKNYLAVKIFFKDKAHVFDVHMPGLYVLKESIILLIGGTKMILRGEGRMGT